MRLGKAAGIAALIGLSAVGAEGKSIAVLGPYIGAGVGYTLTEIDDERIGARLADKGLTMTSISEDNDAFGFKLFGGYLFHENFGIEGGYYNLGKFSYTAKTDPTGVLDGSTQIQGLNLDAVGYLPVWDELSVFARFGIHYAEVQEEYSSSGAVSVTNTDPKENKFGFKFGAGLQYNVSYRLSLRAEWEDYNFREPVGNQGDVNLFSLGLVYRFGEEEKPVVLPPEEVVVVKEVPVPAPAPEPVVVEMPAPPAERVVLVSDSLFDFDKSVVKPAGKSALRRLAAKLQPDDKLVITGHTDSVGSDLYNLKLSQRRADAVMNYLMTLGVPESQMQTRAKGESEPVASNETEEGRAANRRVEVDIFAAPKASETGE